MSTAEVPMILFTIIAQMCVGAFVTLERCRCSLIHVTANVALTA